jgi:hypothetical protein
MKTKNHTMDQHHLTAFYDRVAVLKEAKTRSIFPDDPAGRFLSGLFTVCFKNAEGEGQRFLQAYAQFSRKYLAFLYDLDTMTVLFRQWRRDPEYFSRLSAFGDSFKKGTLPRNVWDEAIHYTSGNSKIEGYKLIHLVLLETVLKEALSQKLNPSELPLGILRHIHFSEYVLQNLKTEREIKRAAKACLGIIPGLYISLLEKGIAPTELLPILSRYTSNYPSTPLFPFNKITRAFLKELAKKTNLSFFPNADTLSLKALSIVYEKNPALFAKFDLSNEVVENKEQWLRILFKPFRVPDFIIWNLFLRKRALSTDDLTWCTEIIAGKSPKAIRVKPYPVSNKMAGLFYQIQKKEMEVDAAILHVGLMAKGLTELQALQLRDSIRDYAYFDYFIEVAVILFRRGVTPQNIRMVWDYLLELKRRGFVLPDLSTCSLTRLSHVIDDWHAEKRLGGRNRRLPKSGIKPFVLALENECTVVVKQITSQLELYREGRAQMHCVYSYLRDVLYYRTFIFSMKMKTPEEESRLLTIEVSDSKIRQIRGQRNRLPNEEEMNWVSRWANSASLTIMGHAA